jgi:hypothetical protein
MGENEFFTYKDGSKTEMCKKCLTMHIDNFDESTFLWLLKKMDVPYVPAEWNTLRDRIYEKDPTKLTSSSVFGRYLSKMKLKQWKQYGWADTETLQKEYEENAKKHEQEAKEREAEAKEKFEAGEISEAEYKTLMTATTKHEIAAAQPQMPIGQVPGSVGMNENDFMSEDELIDTSADLTDEDKLYLAMKWGRLYKPYEWVELERIYNEMTESFDIQDADTVNTLVLICKTNLKMNQALDTGDLDGYQKLSRVSDSLRKSAKFTAAQNKEDKNDFVDSVGELVAMCEKEGFIPRYATDIPQDKVDLTLKDMNDYLHKLVTQDLGFGKQIEEALKKIQIQKEMNEADNFMTDDGSGIEDEDYAAFLEEVEAQKEQDAAIEDDDEEESVGEE